jgi:hypothetical protein
MALAESKKTNILADYHTGKYSQRELSKKHKVGLATVSRLTKEIDPELEHLVDRHISLVEECIELPDEKRNAVFQTAERLVRHKGLIQSVSEALLDRKVKMIRKGTVEEKINVGDGMQQFQARELNASDLKNLADGIDKVSLTLGVNQRHSNMQVAAQVNAGEGQSATTVINIVEDKKDD